MNNQTAYPLSWPNAWPRTPAHRRQPAPFFTVTKRPSSVTPGATWTTKGKRSMNTATDDILSELRRLGAQRVVISTNTELRNDGLPYSNRRAPDDPGAAVYFTLKGKPCVLAVDKWNRVEDNLYAIAKHVEALRGQERWGVGTVEQAFAGYTALPAPGESGSATWYNVLGVPVDAPFEAAQDAYRNEAKLCHPDQPNGAHEKMIRLNQAWDMARKHYNR